MNTWCLVLMSQPSKDSVIVDRLTYARAVIETGTNSYRPAATQARLANT